MAGEYDGAALPRWRKTSLRQKRSQVAADLTGQFTAHHAALLKQLLDHIEYLDAAITRFSHPLAEAISPYGDHVAHLQEIPEVDRAGLRSSSRRWCDTTRFPTAGHLASWWGPVRGITRERRQTTVRENP